MAKFYQIVTIILILGLSIHWLNGNKSGGDLSVVPPCHEPLTFKVGDIDERFSISRDELIDLIERVTAVWSEVVGVPAATYASDGEISVHLVYDDQQQLTDQEREFGSRIRVKETFLGELERNYNEMLEQYNDRILNYQNELHQLQGRIDELNEWVSDRNQEGGLNESQLQDFERRRNEIDRESLQMNHEAMLLSQLADEVNREMDLLNREINHKNELINEYNTRFSGTRRFTQGTYEWQGNRKWINIYQFANLAELELVVAHEMGHALGLDHVENPASVMHHLMGGQERGYLTLSDEDRRALKDRCGL